MIINQLSVRKIKLSELEAFFQSPEYKMMVVKPISPLRIFSYLNNPRKRDDEYILYMAFYKGEMVGFRTILQDKLFVKEQEFNFGWFSGNWVKPELRRHGISLVLYKFIVDDWSGRLIYTNYAPASKQLYDKTTDFDELVSKEGCRFYFKIQIYNLLAHRVAIVRRMKWLIKLVELFLNLCIYPYRFIGRIYWVNKLKQTSVETILTADVLNFIHEHPSSVFKRGSEEYQWIIDFPWIGNNNGKIEYPFSYSSSHFINQYLVLRQNDKVMGLAFVKFNEGKVSVPYFYSEANVENKLAIAVLAWSYLQKANILTIYNANIIRILKHQIFKPVLSKMMNQTYFVNKNFKLLLNYNSSITTQDGDGDVIFT